MKTIVRVLAQTLKSLDDWDGPIDESGTVKIMEDVGADLQTASKEEIARLRECLKQLAEEEKASGNPSGMVKFYENFLYYVGIEEKPPNAA